MKALNLFTNCRSRAGPSTHFNSNPGSDPDSDPGSDPGSDPSSNPGSDPGFTLSLSRNYRTQKVVLFSLKIEVSKVLQMIIKLSVSKTKWTGLFARTRASIN